MAPFLRRDGASTLRRRLNVPAAIKCVGKFAFLATCDRRHGADSPAMNVALRPISGTAPFRSSLPPTSSFVSSSREFPIPSYSMATLFEMEPLEDSGLKLNDAQRRAITHGEGPLLVIAGAGTGKARVITERIRHLLQSDESLSGENILGLTFTKKAAGEMKARVVKAAGERGKAVTLATFHSFCETLLKEVEPNRRALEQVDHWILLRR